MGKCEHGIEAHLRCYGCEPKVAEAALAASQAEVAEEKAAHQGTREALESCVASENALKADVDRLTLGVALITEERDAYRKSGESIAAEHVKVCAGYSDERVAHLKAQEALLVAAASLERARLLLRNTWSTSRHPFQCICTTCEDVRAFLAPPTSIATPGTTCGECNDTGKRPPTGVGTFADGSRDDETDCVCGATPGTPTEEETGR